MKGCLVSGASPRNSPRPPARKCVSFCGSNSSSSSDEEQEIVEVHVADDWDRTPCEITPKLTHKDLLELHELKNSAAYPQCKLNFPRPTQLLNRVPVGLLPLLSEPSTAPPPKPPSKTGSKNTSSIGGAFSPRQSPFLRDPRLPAPSKVNSALASKFSFVPLMPVEDESTSGQTGAMTQSTINPQSPANVPNRFQKKFHFVPLLSDSASSSEPPSDDDHASPVSTPSLTASSSLPSPPGTPSVTSSPSLDPSSVLPSDADYFNLNRPTTGTNQKPDQLLGDGVNTSLSKLTLEAFPSAGLVPPSPFDLNGNKSKGEAPEKLDSSGRLSRKGGKRLIVEYININGVDEPFYTYVDDDEPPSPVGKAGSATVFLPPSHQLSSLYK